ncbi:MAG: hypothetical protein AAFY22_01675 [Pseudomonadota bacterium]
MNPMQLRRTLVSVHLYLAAFLAPAFILVAVSGGLYLTDNKGGTADVALELPAGAALDFKSDTLEADVRALLESAGVSHKFEYLRVRPTAVQTRPTSRDYVQFGQSPDGLTATMKKPDLNYALIELHKGHGPRAFRLYQIAVAVSLFFVALGGLTVGLLAPSFRKQTIVTLGVGALVFGYLAFAA